MRMHSLHFQAVIEIIGVNPYVHVVKSHASQLRAGWKKPMPVTVQINGQPKEPWHINMMPMGNGDFYLYLHGDVRSASETKVGDTVTVDVAFDEDYVSGPQDQPDWFRKQLRINSQAKKNWENLTPSRQKEIVRYLHALKSDAAKERNLQKVMAMLSGQSGRFMARDWRDGK